MAKKKQNLTNAQKVCGGHYKNDKYEVIDIIEDVMGREAIPPKARYSHAQVVRYALRCGKKKGEDWKADMGKIFNYAHRALTGKWVNPEVLKSIMEKN